MEPSSASGGRRWSAAPAPSVSPKLLRLALGYRIQADALGGLSIAARRRLAQAAGGKSMTLNMLLSFAQFEREVTAERIRDKLAASKQRGMWMGGTPPLGYEPSGRSLTIIDEHAELVRLIFRFYLDLGKVRLLQEELKRKGIVKPVRTTKAGRSFGGTFFSRGELYAMLSNPIYIDRIRHRDATYDGLHEPIIDRSLWDAVQAMLADHRNGRRHVRAVVHPSILAGKLFDEAGAKMDCLSCQQEDTAIPLLCQP